MRPHVRRFVLGGAFVTVSLIAYYSAKHFAPTRPEGGPTAGVLTVQAREPGGKRLYENYCLQCHGDKGNGDGPAAVFLYPKPRDFGEVKFRLVSTANRMPSDDDLFRVISHGMPGSAMFPFGHLGEEERKALATYVRQLAKDRVVEQQKAKDETADLAELSADVDKMLQPGEPLNVAGLPPSSPESITRGKELFAGTGCASCHGATGKGDGVQEQKDDKGMPTRPRDFTLGIFKGGREPERLYARIVLGMPGTPMPGSNQLKPPDVGDLANYILSLSPPDAAALVSHRRGRVVAKRVAEHLSGTISDSVWAAVPAVPVVVSPLWWRAYTPPDLRVQAVHDGETLALRLSWLDASRNDSAVRPQDFEDMAAVQLFKGSPEPFLGMGAAGQPVDLWLWRAGWKPNGERADIETTYPNMAVDMYPFEKPGEGPRPHALDRQAPAYVTALAAGNPNVDPHRTFTGSSLQAKRFGSLTMRPRLSQLVGARGDWKHGRWTVVLRRPLAVSADAGLPLAAGDQLSVAFAIWDGAARDRNGQKLVSVWQDLKLE